MADENKGAELLKQWVSGGLEVEGRYTIQNFRFTYLPDVEDGNKLLALCDLVPADGDESTIEDHRFSIGNGWDTPDDGASCVRTDNAKQRYNENTALAKLLASLMKLDSYVDHVTGLHAKGMGATPFEAAFWEGLDVTLEPQTREFPTKETGSDGKPVMATQRWVDAVEFHGQGGAAAATSTKAAPTKAAPAPAPAKATAKAPATPAAAKPKPLKAVPPVPAAAPEPEPVPEPIDTLTIPEDGDLGPMVAASAEVSMLLDIAMQCAEFDDFVTRAYTEVGEVATDEMLQKLVDDAIVWDYRCREDVVAAYSA